MEERIAKAESEMMKHRARWEKSPREEGPDERRANDSPSERASKWEGIWKGGEERNKQKSKTGKEGLVQEKSLATVERGPLNIPR